MPLDLVQQLVAPRDRGAERPLSFWKVEGAGGEQVEAAPEAREDLLRCQHLHPRGCELERQRQPVEPARDLGACSSGSKSGLS